MAANSRVQMPISDAASGNGTPRASVAWSACAPANRQNATQPFASRRAIPMPPPPRSGRCGEARALRGPEIVGEQEREFERLAGIQSRVAARLVAVAQMDVGDLLCAAGAFGDVLARHLEMHAAGMRAFRAVDLEEGLELLHHAVERTGLDPGRGLDG